MKASGQSPRSRMGAHYPVLTAGVEATAENVVLDTKVVTDVERFYLGNGLAGPPLAARRGVEESLLVGESTPRRSSGWLERR